MQVTHTYPAVGVYRPRLTVKDTAETASTNLAEQTITVLGSGGGPSTTLGGNNKLGGALSSLSLLVLSLPGLLRRRRRTVKG